MPVHPPDEGAAPDPAEQASRFAAVLYDELRAQARRSVHRNPRHHSLSPTALVHEVYIRLSRAKSIVWQGRTHFLAVAATQMRRILVEQVRAALAHKRGGALRRITLDERIGAAEDHSVELLALDEALQGLAERSPRRSRVAEMRLFAGLSVDEIAGLVGVSSRTVKQDWRVARAWLTRQLQGPSEDPNE